MKFVLTDDHEVYFTPPQPSIDQAIIYYVKDWTPSVIHHNNIRESDFWIYRVAEGGEMIIHDEKGKTYTVERMSYKRGKISIFPKSLDGICKHKVEWID